MKVFAVEWGNEFPAEVDSLWTTEADAQKRAEEMGGRWNVTVWFVQSEWSPGSGRNR